MSGEGPSPAGLAPAPLEGESLRRSALDALGAWADARTRRALACGELAVEPDVAGWEASTGWMRGHRVTLRLDPKTFAEAQEAPAVIDALCAALALAVSRAAGHALADFVVLPSSSDVERRPYRTPR